LGLPTLFFLTLLYTKSRSGLLGFALADLIFWGGIFLISKTKHLKQFLILHFALLILVAISGTPWTPSLQSAAPVQKSSPPAGTTALQTGGTESGDIRKIVWKGAIDIWKAYPILGTGLETFAFSYYKFRPVEHNLVSEWDFLYNKAHNEYLNFLATAGTIGFLAYLLLIGASLYQISKSRPNFALALGAGYVSILVTNFFGFSVVPVALLFFLYPAVAVTLQLAASSKQQVASKIAANQKIFIGLTLLLTSYLLLLTSRYWYADLLFAKGKVANTSKNYPHAQRLLIKAIKTSPIPQAIYHDELAKTATEISLELFEAGNEEESLRFTKLAISESDKAVKLSPANLNLRRRRASMFLKLVGIDAGFLGAAEKALIEAIEMAPTDAKLYFKLASTYVKAGELDRAIEVLQETIRMKPNYRNARLALAVLFIEKGETEKAKDELKFILTRINPKDEIAKEQLEQLEAGD
jgi:tetratricopeptide (TPR) repeat protein